MAEELKNEEQVVNEELANAEAQPEAVVVTAAEPEAPVEAEKLPRDLFIERIRASRPDGNYDEDEQELFRQAGGLLDELQGGADKYKALSDKLQKRFEESPEEAAAILDYLDGKPLVASIVENMGEEALTMREGMEGWDDFKAAGDARKKRFGESEALLKQLQENAAVTEQTFEDFAAEEGLTDEEKQQLVDVISGDVSATNMGTWSKEMLKRYLRSLRYDRDVEGAREQGKVDGRNERITAERKSMKGSGLPNGSAGGNAETEVDATPMSDTEKFLASIKRR